MRTREPGRARTRPENFTALSPLTFLPRTAAIRSDRVAIVHGYAASRIGIFSRARAGSPDPSPPTASAGATPSRRCCRTCPRCWRPTTACPCWAPCG